MEGVLTFDPGRRFTRYEQIRISGPMPNNVSMLRNLIALITGVLLSFLLTVLGGRLAFLIVVGNAEYTENKDSIVTLMLIHHLVLFPALSVVVGGAVAGITRRSSWWLGGVAVLPLLVYAFILNGGYRQVVPFIIYLGLAFIAAFVTSRFKDPLSKIIRRMLRSTSTSPGSA